MLLLILLGNWDVGKGVGGTARGVGAAEDGLMVMGMVKEPSCV